MSRVDTMPTRRVASIRSRRQAHLVSRLIAIIDAYRDAHGQPSEASVARAIGLSPQAVSSWRKRGLKRPPDQEAMRKLAALAGVDYQTVVLRAALLDAGWVDEERETEDGTDQGATSG